MGIGRRMNKAPHSDRIGYLDGWRGLAVLLVLFGHFVTDRTVNGGRLGVEMFFVLSGRLMAELLFVRIAPLRSFIIRRVSRIYPAFFVAIFGLFALSTTGLVQKASPAHAVSSLLTVYNFSIQSLGRAKIYDHIWSLCVELHTYVLLFGLAWLVRLQKFDALTAIAALAVVEISIGIAMTAAGYGYRITYWHSYVRGASILIGAATYLWFHNDTSRLDRLPAWSPMAFGAIGVVLNSFHVPDPLKYSVGTLALALSMCSLPIAYGWVVRTASAPALKLIGAWSFSIYLWQQGFYALELKLAPLLIPVTIFVGWISFRYIEEPARKRINRWLHARQAKAIQPVTSPS